MNLHVNIALYYSYTIHIVFYVQSQTSFEVSQEPNQSVQHMVVAGVGVWISFHTLDIIRLFHTETLQVLQDINVASPIGRMVTGKSFCFSISK